MITILLVDDHQQVLHGLTMRFALEGDLQVVGTAPTGNAAIELARQLRPDVVVMDVRLPGVDGIAATRLLGQVLPQCAVVILSLYGDPETRRMARSAGAFAFIAKHEMDGPLLEAIRKAARTRQPPE